MTASQSLGETRAGEPRDQFVSLIIAGGLMLALAPIFLFFSQTAWRQDENAHAPFIIAICLAAAYQRAKTYPPADHLRQFEVAGAVFCALLAGALALIGRRFEIDLFLSLAQPGFAVAAVLAYGGRRGLRCFWFPLAMTGYLLVWPGWLIDAATAPLKLGIAETVSGVLYAAGLPVARAGAVISIGSYELMIVDACAGLNSLLALTAIGAVYLYIVKRSSLAINMALFAAAIPLALIANLIRVLLLVLITHYFGYDAGQGFLHDGAGLVMFACALGGFFLLDSLAGVVGGAARR